MKLLSGFKSSAEALKWLKSQGFDKLPVEQALAKIVNEAQNTKFQRCATILTFSDGSALKPDEDLFRMALSRI